MQKDFHYYCVAVVARAAGYQPDEARQIAYASQYVDDSTESEAIPIMARGDVVKFEPVRTAHDLHRLVHMVHAIQWSEQKRVYIPFHFLPPMRFNATAPDKFCFITKEDSELARELVKNALMTGGDSAGKASPPFSRRHLCSVGIALHTYADTWSHADFSGRRSAEENDVEKIRIYNDKTWHTILLHNVLADAAPCIGHAQAESFPDVVCENWCCQLPDNRPVKRNNSKRFLTAAKHMYSILNDFLGAGAVNPVPWKAIEPRIAAMFAFKPKPSKMERFLYKAYRLHEESQLQQRCAVWKTSFLDLFPGGLDYDHEQWRREALEGPTDWNNWAIADWQKQAPRKAKAGFWDSHFFHFHRAALKQRHYVLECLP